MESYGRRPASALLMRTPNYRQWDLDVDADVALDVDAVVHCAALVGDWGREADYQRANVDGTERVMRAAPSRARMVIVSSSSVYSGSTAKSWLREDAPIGDCLSAYGRTKARAEQRVAALRPDAIILRPHIVYGPGDTTLLPGIRSSIHAGQLVVPGTGRNQLSVTHVDNLVLAVERALAAPVHVRGPFNISDEEPAIVDDLLRTILSRAGIVATPRYVPRSVAWAAASLLERAWLSHRPPRGPPLTRYLVSHLADEHTLDITRAREVLGYAPEGSYREMTLEEEGEKVRR